MATVDQRGSRRIGIIAGAGTLPFAVASAIAARGDVPVLFGLRGYCDPVSISRWQHHWIAIGQFGRLFSLLRSETSGDVTAVGSLVRPAVREIRLDFQTLRIMPALFAAFRGGDNHLLTALGRLFEQHGFRLLGIGEVAPQLTVPEGPMTRRRPDDVMLEDIATGRSALTAISAFDVGQAAVVIDRHVVSLEDIEGTDALLARIARLRAERRIRAGAGRGVLVKTPKVGQDLRFDMPTLGPRTIDGVVKAELAGIAVIAGQTLIAEPEAVIAAADRAGIFVIGLPA
jgi:UDP-2,3-diacylglucosamine hydrolase